MKSKVKKRKLYDQFDEGPYDDVLAADPELQALLLAGPQEPAAPPSGMDRRMVAQSLMGGMGMIPGVGPVLDLAAGMGGPPGPVPVNYVPLGAPTQQGRRPAGKKSKKKRRAKASS